MPLIITQGRKHGSNCREPASGYSCPPLVLWAPFCLYGVGITPSEVSKCCKPRCSQAEHGWEVGLLSEMVCGLRFIVSLMGHWQLGVSQGRQHVARSPSSKTKA